MSSIVGRACTERSYNHELKLQDPVLALNDQVTHRSIHRQDLPGGWLCSILKDMSAIYVVQPDKRRMLCSMGLSHTCPSGRFHWSVHMLHDLKYIHQILAQQNNAFGDSSQCRSGLSGILDRRFERFAKKVGRGELILWLPPAIPSSAAILFWALVRIFDTRKRVGPHVCL